MVLEQGLRSLFVGEKRKKRKQKSLFVLDTNVLIPHWDERNYKI